jgi:hypothetical protein
MALAYQQSLALLPHPHRLLDAFQQQPWWRDGIALTPSVRYVGDTTWEIYLCYNGGRYVVLYDLLSGRCDDIANTTSDDR